MAFINKNGQSISFECSELIEELKDDISEFGGVESSLYGVENIKGLQFIQITTLLRMINRSKKTELQKNEQIKKMTMTALLMLLEEQNSIF